jgi:hypothetical protein
MGLSTWCRSLVFRSVMQRLCIIYLHFTDKLPPGSGSGEFSSTPDSSNLSRSSLERLLAPSLEFLPTSASTDNLGAEQLQLHAQPPGWNTTPQRPASATTSTNFALLQPPTTLNTDELCRCRKITVELVEKLCAESANSSQAAIDVLLRYFREALVHCTTVLDCNLCSESVSESSSNMLLTIAGQYMSTICERIAMCYASMRRRNEERQRSLSTPLTWKNGVGFADNEVWNSSGDGSVAVGDMWFSTYHINSSDERMQVVHCLINVQLGDFSRLMERLRSRAGGRSGCLVLLTDAEKRISSAKAILLNSAKANGSRPFIS